MISTPHYLFSLQLACRLPARVQGYPWRLAYSTVRHGTSLKTLYRNLVDVDSPVLLVIKDMDYQVDVLSMSNVTVINGLKDSQQQHPVVITV